MARPVFGAFGELRQNFPSQSELRAPVPKKIKNKKIKKGGREKHKKNLRKTGKRSKQDCEHAQ